MTCCFQVGVLSLCNAKQDFELILCTVGLFFPERHCKASILATSVMLHEGGVQESTKRVKKPNTRLDSNPQPLDNETPTVPLPLPERQLG